MEQSKRKKFEDADETNATIIKITDVNDDCLEIIFKNLEVGDLLNVANSCKRFKQPVDWVFKSKYRDILGVCLGGWCPKRMVEVIIFSCTNCPPN